MVYDSVCGERGSSARAPRGRCAERLQQRWEWLVAAQRTHLCRVESQCQRCILCWSMDDVVDSDARAAQHSAQFQRKDALPKSYCFALFYAALSLLQPVLLRMTISNNCICSHAEDNSRLGSSGAITEFSSQPNISYPYFMGSSTCGANHHCANRLNA